MEGTIQSRDGRLYVLYTLDEQDQPFRRHLWWRVLETRGTGYGDRPDVGDIARSTGGGDWRTRNPSTHRSTGSVSTGTGSTEAETVERFEIHPPATGGKELRWRNGRWERLLARGWVAAGEGRPGKASRTKKTSRASPPRRDGRRLDAEIEEALAMAGPQSPDGSGGR